MIKDVSDYSIVKYIVENTSYYEDYDSFLEVREDVGDDGIVVANAKKSPMQEMLYTLMGVEKFFLDFYDYPRKWKELTGLLEEKCDEMYRIVANSSAELVVGGENLSGDVISPRLFEEYSRPFYNKQAQLLHEKGKIYGLHIDGRLNCIKDIIKRTDIDLIESFTFPEGGGDFSFQEARKPWKNKIIWANFPPSLCYANEKKIREFLIRLLRKVTPRDGFMLEYSEDLPINLWQNTLTVVADTLEKYGNYS